MNEGRFSWRFQKKRDDEILEEAMKESAKLAQQQLLVVEQEAENISHAIEQSVFENTLVISKQQEEAENISKAIEQSAFENTLLLSEQLEEAENTSKAIEQSLLENTLVKNRSDRKRVLCDHVQVEWPERYMNEGTAKEIAHVRAPMDRELDEARAKAESERYAMEVLELPRAEEAAAQALEVEETSTRLVDELATVKKEADRGSSSSSQSSNHNGVVGYAIGAGASNPSQADDNSFRMVVIDNGSGVCKVGYAGNDLPISFPSLVGRLETREARSGTHNKRCYVGEEIVDMVKVPSLSYPIEHGIVIDWEGMANIWHHAFYNELCVSPENCQVLLTEAPLSPKANREKIVAIMFEQFGVQGVFIHMHAVLSLYASGCTTGLFLDSGDGVSHAVPIFEGFVIPHAITRINFAGRDLTAYLAYILHERGHSLRSASELEFVRLAKEALCYVALDYEEALREAEIRDKRRKTLHEASDTEVTFKLPDGNIIAMGSERFRCPEALFRPHIAGKDLPGLQDLVCQSIKACDLSLHKSLFANILLSGGSTLLPSFHKRLEYEVKAQCPIALQNLVKVQAPENRAYSVWKGGAVLASLHAFQKEFVSREAYLEEGPRVVHRCSSLWTIAAT